MTISIVLPAYKEAENLISIIPNIHRALKPLNEQYEILVIDTVEPMDDTISVCNETNAIYITRKGGNLYGDAIRTGFSVAKGQYTVVMDADGSHNPDDIARFFEVMKTCDYDLVIGSRYCKGGNTDNSFILRAMSWLLNVTYRIMFGLKVKDVSDSFRMYHTDQVRALKLECNNFDIVEEILISLKYNTPGFTVKEVPIVFNKRVAGESKRDLKRFILSYLLTMKRLVKIKNKHKQNRKKKK